MSEQRSSVEERLDAWTVHNPHTPVLRTVLRGPLVPWRLGLGRLLSRREVGGGHLVVLTVTGRSSGLPRHVPVVVHQLGGRTYLWCPYGDRAQWYRNVVARPVVTVQSHRGTQVMRASPVEGVEDVLAVVEDLRRFDATFLGSYLDATGIADTPEDLARQAHRLHLRWLEPTPEEGPPPLAADLTWVWPALLAVGSVVLVRWRTRRVRS